MAGKPGTRWIDFDSLRDTISTMRKHLYLSAPFFKCGHCRPLDKCHVCKGEKWIPLSLTPESRSSGGRKGTPYKSELDSYLPSRLQKEKSPSDAEKARCARALRSALSGDYGQSNGTPDTTESDSDSSLRPSE